MNDELFAAIRELCGAEPLRITLSNPKNAVRKYKKQTVRALADGYQIESFTDKQAFHENCPKEALPQKLSDAMEQYFRQCNAVCVGFDYELKLSKKGKLLKNRRKNELREAQSTAHDRKKRYILEEGIFVPALFELGVMTCDGKIVAAKHDKFKQINRFVECIHDVLKDEGKETVEIVDFGCGKSYLTFVLYHYMTVVCGKKARIVGLDLKRDVIENCARIAEKYGYDGLSFLCCDIKDYVPKTPPDMVVSLHACDTATDYALYNAIAWKASYIFSVPCCQHELNQTASPDALRFMTGYGLIRERLCALATDALRGKLLEQNGYRTELLEFIDLDNSPKNILIRARRTAPPNTYKKRALETEIGEFEKTFGVKLTLQRLLEAKKAENDGVKESK